MGKVIKQLLLAVAAAVVAVLLLESGLRMVDYRSAAADPYESFVLHSPLFVPATADMVTSPDRLRFFHPETFQRRKPPGTFRLFALGGSVTYGYQLSAPRSQNYCRLLDTLLDSNHPHRSFEVINCGGICYASYRLVDIARECLEHEPDLIVLVCGHNEFLEPRHYGDILAGVRPGLPWWYSLRTVHFAMDVRSRFDRANDTAPKGGRATPVLADDRIEERYVVREEQEFAHTLAHFTRNLRLIVSGCKASGTSIILCTLPSNLRDWPPFVTVPTDQLPEGILEEQLRRVNDLVNAGRHREALAVADEVVENHHRAAAFHYAAGLALDGLGKTAEAATRYRLAMDTDGFPHRALTSFNEAVREIAAAADVPLFDIERLFARSSPDGIPGRNLFLDQCHPNVEGHELIAEGLAKLIASMIPED